MNCPECGRVILDGRLACTACFEKRAWTEARRMAGRHVPDIFQGRLWLRVVRKMPTSGPLHVALPNHYGSFCGLDLRDHRYTRKKTLNEARDLPAICDKCMGEIYRLKTAYEMHG
jgi:hypothetical protein